MGFFKKIWNLITGKGYKEEQEETEITQREEYIEETPTLQETTNEQKEEIKEIVKPKVKTYIDTVEDKSKKELQTLKQTLQTKPEKKEIEKKIDKEITNSITLQQITNNVNDLKPLYTKIFTDNAKLLLRS